MNGGDFYGSEQSAVIAAAGALRIEFVGREGARRRSSRTAVKVAAGDVVAATAMSRRALRAFFAKAIDEAQADGLLLSLHLKATMMKVSDPIMFGHAVTAYYRRRRSTSTRRRSRRSASIPTTASATSTPRSRRCRAEQRAAIEADLQAVYATRPPLAMVDSSRGITNLHVPSDVIIDASMPAAIRASGQMWGPDGKLHDTQGDDPGPLLRRASTRRRSTTAAATARSTCGRWARSPTSA